MNTSFTRERVAVRSAGESTLALQCQRCGDAPLADVIYVHGATFGADLSVYFVFDGRSWADALCTAGFDVWGFDFAGYGASDRYPATHEGPAGAIDDAATQLRRVVDAVRARNGGRAVVLLAHSRGGLVAARHAATRPHDVSALALFAPPVLRMEREPSEAPRAAHFPLTIWAQYRRFIVDVPRGHAPVLADAHIEAWSAAFLRSDPTATQRTPASVMTPCGPLADIDALYAGQPLFDAASIVAPTLLVRGAWDSVCNDDDAARLLAELGSTDKADVRIDGATHLMHLEQQRTALYDEVNRFLRARLHAPH